MSEDKCRRGHEDIRHQARDLEMYSAEEDPRFVLKWFLELPLWVPVLIIIGMDYVLRWLKEDG